MTDIRYNAAVGASLSAINRLIESLYPILHEPYLKGQYHSDVPIPVTVVYDVLEAPVLNFRKLPPPPADALDPDALQVFTTLGAQPEDIQKFIEHVAASTISVTASFPRTHVEFRLGTGQMHDVMGSLWLEAEATVGPDYRLRILIVSAHFSLSEPQDPNLEKITNALLKGALPNINQRLKDGFLLNKIHFQGATLAAPALVAAFGKEGPLAAGYAALEGTGPSEAPPNIPCSSPDLVFVQFDSQLANVVGNDFIKDARKHDSAKFRATDQLGTGIEVEAWFDVGVKDLRFELLNNNSTTVTLEAWVEGYADIHLLFLGREWSWVRVGLRASARPPCLASLSLLDGWVRIQSLMPRDDLDLKLEFYGVPDWLNWAISKLLSGLLTPISVIVLGFLSALKIPVYQLPEVEIPGTGRRITLQRAQITTFDAGAGKNLCEVSGLWLANSAGAEEGPEGGQLLAADPQGSDRV